MKIAVGMSGGVDSSVAALLLKQWGHDVVGVTMKIWRGSGRAAPRGNACYGPEEVEDIETARATCGRLNVPYRVIDCSEQYERIVLGYFKTEYRSGRTPNPCIRCNQEIKFGVFPELVRASGIAFERFATGHYARVERDVSSNRFLLKKGVDTQKDQSYFLYRLSQEQLALIEFPLGGLLKERVRAMARESGLSVHDKAESQDFYAGHYGDVIGEPGWPGDIVDGAGRDLGRHRGIFHYTVGQRKGLGIAYAEPLYVLRIDAEQNRIVVGAERETKRSAFTVTDCVWSGIGRPESAVEAQVKIRSQAPPIEAVVSPGVEGAARVELVTAASAITPGQSAVFYHHDILLGGGVIDEVE